MLQIKDLHYAIGARELLAGINWIIQPDQRVALIGPNGAGKTTLLKILTGEIRYQVGTINKPKGYRIGYLPQEEIAVGRGTILETVLEGEKQLIELENKIAELHQALDSAGENHSKILKADIVKNKINIKILIC